MNCLGDPVVTAAQMRQIEDRVIAAGMPVAALMEKVANLITARIVALGTPPGVAVLAGPGHNGGDALVVARELWQRGYRVQVCCPLPSLKPLTASHAAYLRHLEVPWVERVEELGSHEVLVDGLFGFGLERSPTGLAAEQIAAVNQGGAQVISIDLPSGLHTDTGEVLGTAVRADHTLCLGLWKAGLLQECSLDWAGQVELVGFHLPPKDLQAVLGTTPAIQTITPGGVRDLLCQARPRTAHKYQLGHLLLICGSQRYPGAALLAGMAAQTTGVGMLSVAVPASISTLITSHLPGALVVPCPETDSGALTWPASLEAQVQEGKFTAIACGPGLTREPRPLVEAICRVGVPLVLDADALNIVAELGPARCLGARQAPTVLTPHRGEFARLFPHLSLNSPWEAVRAAARLTRAVVLLKGARTVIADPEGNLGINPESTAALARGGTGDVLTGLVGGLAAQGGDNWLTLVAAAVWWHSQAGLRAAAQRTERGVDPQTLGEFLLPVLRDLTRAHPQGAGAAGPDTGSPLGRRCRGT